MSLSRRQRRQLMGIQKTKAKNKQTTTTTKNLKIVRVTSAFSFHLFPLSLRTVDVFPVVKAATGNTCAVRRLLPTLLNREYF